MAWDLHAVLLLRRVMGYAGSRGASGNWMVARQLPQPTDKVAVGLCLFCSTFHRHYQSRGSTQPWESEWRCAYAVLQAGH